MRLRARLAAAGGRRLGAEALPLLHDSPEGRTFLAAAGPRAFALGAPAARCPARAAGAGPAPAAAAEAALSACFAQLAAAGGAGPDCGCRLLVLDDTLLAPPEDFAYAPGVSARLVAPAADLALHLVAREAADPELPDARRVSLHPAPRGGPAEALLLPDGRAELRLGAERWTGRREAEGLTRGRFRERLILRREGDGARGVLALNWDPAPWTEARARLLAPLRR